MNISNVRLAWAAGFALVLVGCRGSTSILEADPAAPVAAEAASGTLRRLNRTEYGNTVRDLLGLRSSFGASFPPDSQLLGFDKVSEGLSLSPHLVEQYHLAAEQIANELFARGATPEAASGVLTCDPQVRRSCVESTIERLATRAWRRPITALETRSLLRLTKLAHSNGDSITEGLKLAVRAILTSPHFLFLTELPPAPDSRALTGHEVASRLSYLLWSSMPDDALFVAAASGALANAEVRVRETRRMLADPRSESFITGFSSQWFHLGRLADRQLNVAETPTSPTIADLRSWFSTETQLFTREVLTRLPLDQLLLGKFSFMSGELRSFYGIEADRGLVGFERVDLPANSARGGLLTQGAVLALTSNYDRTSPVNRGVWVLEALLCAPPPPPPAGVITELAPRATGVAMSLRQSLEQHRADPACAACHRIMDPLGYPLESFDVIGRLRTDDNGAPLDTSGEYLDGSPIQGAADLQEKIANDPRFYQCAAEKLLAYALGRQIDRAGTMDGTLVEELGRRLQSHKSWPLLVEDIVSAPAFAEHRAGAPGQDGASR